MQQDSAEWVLASACQNPQHVYLQHKLMQALASTSTAEQVSDITCCNVVWLKGKINYRVLVLFFIQLQMHFTKTTKNKNIAQPITVIDYHKMKYILHQLKIFLVL